MTAFELFFGLTSVILALALTHLANSFQLLLRAGRRVRWAIEPMLQSALILMIVVFVWADQWSVREQVAFTLAQSILQVLKLLAVYVAAAAVLPEPGETANLDLRDYYMASRRVTYGALLLGLFLFIAYRFLYLPADHVPLNNSLGYALGIPLLYVSMMIVRWRAFHVAALILLCLAYAVQIAPVTIGG
jgi:hypothetical protein